MKSKSEILINFFYALLLAIENLISKIFIKIFITLECEHEFDFDDEMLLITQFPVMYVGHYGHSDGYGEQLFATEDRQFCFYFNS